MTSNIFFLYLFLLLFFDPVSTLGLDSLTIISPTLILENNFPPDSSPAFSLTDNKEVDLLSVTQVYADTTGTLDINALDGKEFSFISESEIISGPNTYWAKLTIKSKFATTTNWRLSLFTNWCEKVEVYSKAKNQNSPWLIQRAGYLTSLQDLDINETIPINVQKVPNAITLSFQAEEEKIIFIRYQREHRLSLRITPKLIPLLTASNQITTHDRDHFIIVAFMGFLFILAFYHLLIFFFNKDRAYLYYALYGFCSTIGTTIMDEYGWLTYHLFYTNYPFLQSWVFIYVGVFSIISYILFTRSFLNTKKRFPRLDKIILILLLWNCLVAILSSINLALTNRQFIPFIPFSSIIVFVAITYIYLIYSVWKKRCATDMFYMLGLFFLMISLLPVHLSILFNWTDMLQKLEKLLPLQLFQVGTIAELVIFALGLGYRTKQIEREKQRFQELDSLKSRFFTNISHEFRTPLTLVIGPLMQLKEKLTDSKLQQQVQLAHKNANRLLQLISQLLDLSKLEAGKMKLITREQNIVTLLKGITMSFQSLAEGREIHLQFVSEKQNIPLYVDQDKIEKIFYNLLANAFKFTENHGEIVVMVIERKKVVEILVQDNGIGIEPKGLPHIFNRFYRTENAEDQDKHGTGIGLALVKELVEIQKGTIKVTSEVGKGTTLILQFPLGTKHLQQEEILTPAFAKQESIRSLGAHLFEFLLPMTNTNLGIANQKEYLHLEQSTTEHLPVVLIIEDHTDVRTYIQQHLETSFQILEAVDGQDGINQALAHLPDLVISDVMMPKKNGYEVCQTLKTDPHTSHIPIILLTAKAAQEEKLKGLTYGADDYLIKPFDTQELKTRVCNLIDLRIQLRRQFSEQKHADRHYSKSNAVDNEFMEQVCHIIESNLACDQFGVEVLAKEIGMSRSHFNKKLKALTDQSGNKFIQSFRLERADEMLRNKEGNVSEIALKTGFNSLSYFIKCFREKFDITPGSLM